MTQAEKAELVNYLAEPADVAAYNDYRYFHEFLARANLYFNVHKQNADSRYWQMRSRLCLLHLAETENFNMLLDLPKIMTRRQYDQARSLFNPTGEEGFGRGVAIVETDGFPEGTYRLTPLGQFQYPVPCPRTINMAEDFLKEAEDFASNLASFRAAFEVMGKFLETPELGDMVRDLDLRQVDSLNGIMADLPASVVRRGLMSGERPEAELRDELAALFQPIEIKCLRPLAKLRAKALRAMDFSVARGNSEKIYEILRREDD